MAFKVVRCLLFNHLKRIGESPQEFAIRMKMPISQISDWGHNRKKMRIENAKTVANGLGLNSIDELYEWVEIKKEPKK